MITLKVKNLQSVLSTNNEVLFKKIDKNLLTAAMWVIVSWNCSTKVSDISQTALKLNVKPEPHLQKCCPENSKYFF